MLAQCSTFPVDELYLNMMEQGPVSRLGVNNGIVIDTPIADPKSLVPAESVRILATLVNIPLILSAERTYEVPVEVSPFPFMAESGTIRDVIVKSRNYHRASPDHYPLRYRRLSTQDMYSFGLTYNFMIKKLGVTPHKFHKDDLDFVVDESYIDNALEQHAMSDTFACEHAADFCAVMIDPRLHIGPGGEFNYPDVSRLLGFGSFELACQLTRKFIELHGTDSLPCDGPTMRQLLQKVTGRNDVALSHPSQVLGARVLHNILVTPLDNLNVNLKDVGTRLARDAEVVRQRLHQLINDWLVRLCGDKWAVDEYSADLFDMKEEEDSDV